jgi:release factor glutamine methyltransferase
VTGARPPAAGRAVADQVATLLRLAERRLAGAGVPSPRHDAQALLDHVLGDPNARHTATRVPAAAAQAYLRAVDRRAGREPLQHILGTAAFRRLLLAVGPGVFVPRPETELLVEWGLAQLAGHRSPTVVDLCAGSGAVALSVAAEHPGATVYAVELAPAALRWLHRNAAGSAAVQVVPGDATDPAVLAALDGTADLVLANPPYIPAGTPLPPEVARFDPPQALWGGPDGLQAVRGVLARAVTLLRPGGGLGVEHAESHAAAMGDLLRARGLEQVTTHHDLSDRPRFSTARRPG